MPNQGVERWKRIVGLLVAIAIAGCPILPGLRARFPKELFTKLIACTGSSQCDPSLVICAATSPTPVCRDGSCHFALDASNTSCNCVEGDVSDCDLGCPKAPGNCNRGLKSCVASGSAATNWGTCTKATACPADGASQACATGVSSCPFGTQSFSCASGWSACQCQPCGGDGQPCCNGTSCSGGETCGSDGKCKREDTPPPPVAQYCVDADGDGYCTSECQSAPVGSLAKPWRSECLAPGEAPKCDQDPRVHPGQIEICDDLDNNCDGGCNEGGVCGNPVIVHEHFSFGPNLFGEKIDKTFGGPCGNRFTKGDCSAHTTNGAPPAHSHCEGNWVNPNDPNDCTCHIHFGAKSGAHGECDMNVVKAMLPCR